MALKNIRGTAKSTVKKSGTFVGDVRKSFQGFGRALARVLVRPVASFPHLEHRTTPLRDWRSLHFPTRTWC